MVSDEAVALVLVIVFAFVAILIIVLICVLLRKLAHSGHGGHIDYIPDSAKYDDSDDFEWAHRDELEPSLPPVGYAGGFGVDNMAADSLRGQPIMMMRDSVDPSEHAPVPVAVPVSPLDDDGNQSADDVTWAEMERRRLWGGDLSSSTVTQAPMTAPPPPGSRMRSNSRASGRFLVDKSGWRPASPAVGDGGMIMSSSGFVPIGVEETPVHEEPVVRPDPQMPMQIIRSDARHAVEHDEGVDHNRGTVHRTEAAPPPLPATYEPSGSSSEEGLDNEAAPLSSSTDTSSGTRSSLLPPPAAPLQLGEDGASESTELEPSTDGGASTSRSAASLPPEPPPPGGTATTPDRHTVSRNRALTLPSWAPPALPPTDDDAESEYSTSSSVALGVPPPPVPVLHGVHTEHSEDDSTSAVSSASFSASGMPPAPLPPVAVTGGDQDGGASSDSEGASTTTSTVVSVGDTPQHAPAPPLQVTVEGETSDGEEGGETSDAEEGETSDGEEEDSRSDGGSVASTASLPLPPESPPQTPMGAHGQEEQSESTASSTAMAAPPVPPPMDPSDDDESTASSAAMAAPPVPPPMDPSDDDESTASSAAMAAPPVPPPMDPSDDDNVDDNDREAPPMPPALMEDDSDASTSLSHMSSAAAEELGDSSSTIIDEDASGSWGSRSMLPPPPPVPGPTDNSSTQAPPPLPDMLSSSSTFLSEGSELGYGDDDDSTVVDTDEDM